MSFKIPDPKPVAKTTRLVLRHAPASNLHTMLQHAYDTLGEQLRQFKSKAITETFDSATATAFAKMVNALVQLQETERKAQQVLNLPELSDAELDNLLGTGAAKALKLDPVSPQGPPLTQSGSESHYPAQELQETPVTQEVSDLDPPKK